MNIGLYQSAASLSALERWQDAVSENITSSQTNGFRKRTAEFSAQGVGEWRGETGSKGNTSSFTQPALFPKITTGVNFATGETQATRGTFDFAIQGEGFFEIRQPNGELTYTRNGEFRVRNDHTLVAGGDAEVLNEDGSPITLLPGDQPLVVDETGTLTQGSTRLGKLAIRTTDQPGNLIPLSGGLFRAAPGTEMKQVEKPEVMQGYLEQSNVSSLREMVDLVLISRAYEANQKVISAIDEQMQKSLDALG